MTLLNRPSALLAVLAFFYAGANPASASTITFFHQSAFAASTGALSTATFDNLSPCNGCVVGNEYAGLGLTITQLAGIPMNIVQNVASPYGANFVTLGNINSGPNALSSSVYTTGADQSEDSFDFIFTSPVGAAGLFVGNLGNNSNTLTTHVFFLDAQGGTIASALLDRTNPAILAGAFVSTVPWDVRLFYGITSTTPIKRIRVINGPNDGDGILIDDVQFGSASTTAVPEPESLMLMGLGLSVVAVRLRRLRVS